jgi:MinD-like ATPase involved in chromosome partitioning or flagellar assembly
VELPTYTNIWKIEKRLYKLYDFRLPMPLPIGQVAAFLAIAIPYMLALSLVGMPFSHTWVWLYVLPPGVAAWLVTRPVLEGKRLPELVVSQVRYLTEPRTWCRLAPLAENDSVVVVARVWRAPAGPVLSPRVPSPRVPSPRVPRPGVLSPSGVPDETAAAAAHPAVTPQPGWPDPSAARARVRPPAARVPIDVPARLAAAPNPASRERSAAGASTPAAVEWAAAEGAASADAAAGPDFELGGSAAAGAGDTDRVAVAEADPVAAADAVADAVADAELVADANAVAPGDIVDAVDLSGATDAVEGSDSSAAADVAALTDGIAAVEADGTSVHQRDMLDSARLTREAAGTRPAPTVKPMLRVRADPSSGRPLHVVERALRTSRGGWQDRVVVVPGGYRPGSPDHTQRDQARARLPLAGPARIVVLGTTVGAGQTVTTLLTGQLLASLRAEAVAVLDFGGRPGSLTELARQVPRLLPSRLVGGQPASDHATRDRPRGLQVVTADHSGPGPRDADRVIDAVAARYPITLADPAPADVPRAVQVADQLVLVTPAGENSAGSLARTLEWLDAHGHGRLAQTSVTVLNGVTQQTAEDAQRATTVASGRCRAIVRVPWEHSLSGGGQLSAATVHAYTALAGVLVSGMADPALAGSAGAGNPGR